MGRVINYGIAESGADATCTEQIGSLLNQHYPFVSWHVDADGGRGTVIIECPELHGVAGNGYGFVIKLEKIKNWDDLKRTAIQAGGELLERANASRTTGNRFSEEVDRS